MSSPSQSELVDEALGLIAAANPRVVNLELWTELVAGAIRMAPAKDEVSRIASQLGEARATGAATVESLVNEFSMVRRILEDLVTSDGSAGQARKKWEIVRASLDTALASAISAYTQVRSTQARRDPVTGLADRAAFEVCLLEEIDRAKRYQRQFTLVLFDLDHFKSINDQLGHLEGDRVLAEVGRVLTRTLRRSDQVFRYGGDEFAALCLESGEDAIGSVLRRVEGSLASLGSLGISAGVASFPSEASDGLGLVRLADERLYECKRGRRGR